MLTPDVYSSLKDYELNELPAVLAKAEQHRLLSEAGLIRRPWLLRQVFRSLWELGHLITKAGLRLERRYAPLTWATHEVR
jgi:hypothetical protein